MTHLVLIPLAALGFAAGDGDWPQFRGPGGQGQASVVSLPTTWSENSNVIWKTPIPGLGWSSPVIAGDQIWVTTALDDGQSLRAVCVDRNTGKIVHNVEVFAPESPVHINAKNSFASPTPILEGNRVYVNFGTMGTACLDTKTGAIVWKNNELKVDHMEGPGSSPIPVGDKLVVHCDGSDVQFIVALNKSDGKIAWKTPRTGKLRPRPDFHKAYCTPLVIERGGKKLLVSPAADSVYTYEAETGKEIGRLSYVGFSNVPRPLEAHGLVFFTTGYMQPQLWALKIGDDGKLSPESAIWKYKDQVPANPSPIIVDDLLYMTSDRGILTCLEAKTGTMVYRERLSGASTASPIVANGLLYFFTENGAGHVVKPGRTFASVAKNSLDGRIQASPAALDRALYVRTATHLYRIQELVR